MTANIQGLAQFLMFGLIADNEATVNLFGFSPADGFMVGGVVEESTYRFASGEHIKLISEFIREHEDILSDPELFVSAWVMGRLVHLDIVERFATQREADVIARFRDQDIQFTRNF